MHTSLISPKRVFDYDFRTGSVTVLKQQEEGCHLDEAAALLDPAALGGFFVATWTVP